MRLFAKLMILAQMITLNVVFATSNPLPEKYRRPHTTFVYNKKLSLDANIFLHAIPQVSVPVLMQYAKDPNPNMVLRKTYEAFAKEFAGGPTPIESVKDMQVSVEDHTVPVRVYQRNPITKNRVLMYVHGGGWARGNLETHDELCRRLCKELNVTVIAVDYRLAPEHKFPLGFDDVKGVYQWLLNNRSTLNLEEKAEIMMAGDSAGGNLVTSCNLFLIDQHLPLPSKVVLIYPALDLEIPEITHNAYAEGYLLTRESTNAYIRDYLTNPEEAKTNPYISPIKATPEQLRAFPKTFIVSAECDILAEQAEGFVKRAKKAGNKQITRHVVPGVPHIFAQFFGIFKEAEQTLNKMVKFLK